MRTTYGLRGILQPYGVDHRGFHEGPCMRELSITVSFTVHLRSSSLQLRHMNFIICFILLEQIAIVVKKLYLME